MWIKLSLYKDLWHYKQYIAFILVSLLFSFLLAFNNHDTMKILFELFLPSLHGNARGALKSFPLQQITYFLNIFSFTTLQCNLMP